MNNVKEEHEEQLKEKLRATQVKKSKKEKTVTNSSSLTLQKNIKLNSNLIIPKNKEELEVMVKNLHASLDIKDVKIEELHNLTMILDERWHDPYKQWLEIGWLYIILMLIYCSGLGLAFQQKVINLILMKYQKCGICGIVTLKTKVLLLEQFIIM